AGWPASTPEAQCIGPFQAEFGLLLHGPRSAAVIDEIERAADDVLFPLTGETLRSALHTPEPTGGVELHGEGLGFSCMKESEDGDALVLRCVNLLDRRAKGEWRLPGNRQIAQAHRARLDETPTEPLGHSTSAVRFTAAPREIVTILVR
ncbi:MAG: glycosyl hydrolase-related protein, partial [Gemmatimonadaceae bacterium]